MTAKQKRGIRNNNPGNIEYRASTKWQGVMGIEADPQGGGAARFAVFKDATYGIRAIARLLITYYDKHGCDTVGKIISRWAPPTENNTRSYARAVARDVGVGVDEVINLHEYQIIRPIVCGIIEHENGLLSYADAYTETQIDKGLVLAGVEPLKKPLAQSRTIKGAGIASAGVTLSAATEIVAEVQDQIEPLVSYADVLVLVFLLVAFVGIGLTVWARIDDRRKGLR